MIALDNPSAPREAQSVEELHEILLSTLGRTVRLRQSLKKPVVQLYISQKRMDKQPKVTSLTITDLAGSLDLVKLYDSSEYFEEDGATAPELKLTLQVGGQTARQVLPATTRVDLFQEDTGLWATIHRGSEWIDHSTLKKEDK